ncbi:uronyl 2-sulfotransferase-like [Anneissia japonica]|uniref:uronyl 2-sulfotransferase-like n=1 Tax=Anneissia japonica TaxID=1529436 RepID=UPI00142553EE|nr:uronyl 2-sulfotransferase-like [Anneissia japonica]XP_033099540.1 uronyl 2-sulfotransferase-like [Anneissia japonica]
MRLLKGARIYILLVIAVCCYAWYLTQKRFLIKHVLKLQTTDVRAKPNLAQLNKHHILDGKFADGSIKWTSNSEFDRIAETKNNVSWSSDESSWNFDNGNDTNPKRIYEWNETVVYQGLLPLVDQLDLNNDGSDNKPRIIFNRVGKCGSRSVLDIFRILAERNQFNMIESLVYTQKILPPEKEEMMAQVLSQLQAPYLFQRHMYHINFNYYGLKSPSYINIIRDPIARFTSQYYFKRFGDGFQQRTWTFNGTESEKYQTINDCVLNNKYECSQRRMFYILPFFCGNDPRCKYPTDWTLARAMENVRKDFKVIGLLEELHDTFLVLEKTWPTVFRGCVNLLMHPSKGQQLNRTAALTKAKEKPSPKVTAILKDQMALEYRFYNFVKSRFHALKRKLGINKSLRQTT